MDETNYFLTGNCTDEDFYEQTNIEYSTAYPGYEYLHSPDLMRTPEKYDDVFIPEVLPAALRKVNPSLPAQAIQEAIIKLNGVVDAREMGTMVTLKLREFTKEGIAKVDKTLDDFRAGTLEDEKGFCAAIGIEDIAKKDYILTSGRSVGIADIKEDGEPFNEKMTRLTGEQGKMFEESNRLQEQTKKNLEAVSYEF